MPQNIEEITYAVVSILRDFDYLNIRHILEIINNLDSGWPAFLQSTVREQKITRCLQKMSADGFVTFAINCGDDIYRNYEAIDSSVDPSNDKLGYGLTSKGHELFENMTAKHAKTSVALEFPIVVHSIRHRKECENKNQVKD